MTLACSPARVASRGFTFVELLFVMAIVAILASVAYPAYTSQVNRAHRAQARAVLLEAAQFMERYYAANNSYANAELPARLSTSPPGAQANAARYTLAVTASATAFTLTAVPGRADDCGTLGLTHTGQRSSSGGSLGSAECWR